MSSMAGRRGPAHISSERFRAQLPAALAELERGDGDDLQALLDARLGDLRRASVDEIVVAGKDGQLHVMETLMQVIKSSELLGMSQESLPDVRQMLEAVGRLRPAAESGIPADTPNEVPLNLSPKALLGRVQGLRKEASGHFKSGELQAAARALESAMESLRPYRSRWCGVDVRKGSLVEQLRACHLGVAMNLSLCYLEGKPPSFPAQPARVLECCIDALELDPGNAKAHARKGKALALLALHAQAEVEYARAIELDPTDLAIQKELAIVKEAIRESEQAAQQEAFKAAAAMHGESTLDEDVAGIRENVTRASAGSSPCHAPRVQEDARNGAAGQAARANVHCWPEGLYASPRSSGTIDKVQAMVEQLAQSFADDQELSCSSSVLQAVQQVVTCRFGGGAGQELDRVGALIEDMVDGQHALPSSRSDGALVSAALEGLIPEQPLYAMADYPWCATLASSSSTVLQEVQRIDAASWEEPVVWGIPHRENTWMGKLPDWQTLLLVQQGVWVAGERFQQTRRLLSSLQGMRPCEIYVSRIPPHGQAQLHWDSTNFILGAHLGLESDSGCCIEVGTHRNEELQGLKLRAGDAVITSHLWRHAAHNKSDTPRHVLSCFFYHSKVSEVERYALQVLLLLAEGLEGEGIEMLRRTTQSAF